MDMAVTSTAAAASASASGEDSAIAVVTAASPGAAVAATSAGIDISVATASSPGAAAIGETTEASRRMAEIFIALVWWIERNDIMALVELNVIEIYEMKAFRWHKSLTEQRKGE
jgi:hypothetical protein